MLTPHEIEKEKEIRSFYFFSVTIFCLRIESEINGSTIFSNCPRFSQPRVISVRIRVGVHQANHIVIEKVATKSTVCIRADRSQGTREISHENFPCSPFFGFRRGKLLFIASVHPFQILWQIIN